MRSYLLAACALIVGSSVVWAQVGGGGVSGPTTGPNNYVRSLRPVTFATLPACAATLEGALAEVTDSTTITWGATITGSGANKVLAHCNGTNWTVAGS